MVLFPLLLVLFPCTSVRAQEDVWLSSHALTLIDSIQIGFQDWQQRTQKLNEDNLTSGKERLQETNLLADKARNLLQSTYQYIGAYGFPGKPPEDLALKGAKAELMKAWLALPANYTLGRKKIMAQLISLDASKIERFRAQQIFLTLLNTERDFDQRCMMTGTLRLEYEKGTYNAYQLFLYLEETYKVLHNGDSLSFAPGTNNTHKLSTYAAELDGCW